MLLVAVVCATMFSACGEDYQDDIDQLNERHNALERRVVSLETQVATANSQLETLAKLSAAVEQNFYITSVKTTADGYELTLSNGRVILLQNGPDNTLLPMPAVSMTKLGGVFYWTLDGVLLTDDNGQPLRTTDVTPVVKYDYVNMQWLVSVDGGVTFTTVNVFASMVINDEVLLQIINSYVREHSSAIISQDILYQIISTYIMENYRRLFNADMLHRTIYAYVHEHYNTVFSYDLLEKIFNRYNYEYATSHVDVEALIELLLSFIREHQEVFVNNEVLYEIFTNYMEENKTTVFDDQLLLEVFNTFIQENKDYINVDLLRQIIYNYLDQHQDVIVNNELIMNLLMQYVENNYTLIFDRQILSQLFNKYITLNFTTIFNETLIREFVTNYVENNFNTFIDNETIKRLINNYITENQTTVISREVLIDIVTKYFLVNYNVFIKLVDIEAVINNYVNRHETKLFDVDIIEDVVMNYLKVYYNEVFNVSVLEEIITNYFNNTTYINEYISRYTGIISGITVTDEYCEITYNKSQTIRLVIYDEFTRLRDRLQTIVILPEATGHVTETKGDYAGYLNLNYMVTPASMAEVIVAKAWSGEVTLEMKATDEEGNISTLPAYEFYSSGEGIINIHTSTPEFGQVKAIALHVKDNKVSGTDILTEFTVVDAEFDPRILQEIPEEYLRRMRPYMPIYSGKEPPVIEGTFLLSKDVLVYSSDGYSSDNFADYVTEFTNQDMVQNTVIFREESRSSNRVLSKSEREQAVVLGKGNNFTVFLIVNGMRSDGVTTTKMATILSGTMTTSGIRDFHYGFVMLDKHDPNGVVMDIGEFRIFKDQDGMSEPTSWMARQYLPATVPSVTVLQQPRVTTQLLLPYCSASTPSNSK